MDARCSVSGCDREAKAHGLCQAHYMRQRRTGRTGESAIKTIREPEDDREPILTSVKTTTASAIRREADAKRQSVAAVVAEILDRWARRRT